MAVETKRVERWAVMVPGPMNRDEIANVPVSTLAVPGTYFVRDDAAWALEKIGEGRIVHLVEVRDGEEVMTSSIRRLLTVASYGDGWPRTAKREADERELFTAWDAACVATNLERVDPPYQTLRAFLRLLPDDADSERLNWLARQVGVHLAQQSVATTKSDPNTGEHYETEVAVLVRTDYNGDRIGEQFMHDDLRGAIDAAMLAHPTPEPATFDFDPVDVL